MKKHIEAKTVRDIMTAFPMTVYPDTSIRELKILFERSHVNMFPVVDDRGVLRGVVSRLDFLRVFRPDMRRRLSSLFALWAERVEEIMSRGSDTVEPGDAVVTAVDLMIATGRRSLPVVERRPIGPVLVGMVSRTDLFPCLTLAAEESPTDGGSHLPGPASPARQSRRSGRSQGSRRVLKAMAARVGGALEAIVTRALPPRRRRPRKESEVWRTGESHVRDDRLAAMRVSWARQRGIARQEAVRAD